MKKVANMLSCEEVLLGISDYMTGKLSAHLSERFRAHIANCKRCPEISIICGTVVLQERPCLQRIHQRAKINRVARRSILESRINRPDSRIRSECLGLRRPSDLLADLHLQIPPKDARD